MTDWDSDYGGIFSTSIFGAAGKFEVPWDKTDALDALVDDEQSRQWDHRREERVWPKSIRELDSGRPRTLEALFSEHTADGVEVRLIRTYPTHMQGLLETLTLVEEDFPPFSDESIARDFGSGSYRVEMYGPNKRGTRVLLGAVRIEVRDTAKVMRQPVPSTAPPAWLSDFYLPLGNLSAMLVSACDPVTLEAPSREVAHGIVDGWMSMFDVTDRRFALPAFDAEEPFRNFDLTPSLARFYKEHPKEAKRLVQVARRRFAEDWSKPARWRQLLPGFDIASDTDIYRAYVESAQLADRPTTKEYILMGISKVRVACEREAVREGERQRRDGGRWYLWLDDERDPKVVLAADNGEACLGERYEQYVAAGLVDVEWRWAQSAEQAMRFVEAYGHPRVMGLDHDLGPGETTMAFLRWMSDRNYHVPQWYVHSANPVGRANIESFMRSWSKFAYGTAEEKAEAVKALVPQQAVSSQSDDGLDDDLDGDGEADDPQFFVAEAAAAENASSIGLADDEAAARDLRRPIANE